MAKQPISNDTILPKAHLTFSPFFCSTRAARLQSAFYLPTASEIEGKGFDWVLAFVALAASTIIGHLLEALGFAISGERLTRRMREAAFKAVSAMLIDPQTTTWFHDPVVFVKRVKEVRYPARGAVRLKFCQGCSDDVVRSFARGLPVKTSDGLGMWS